MGQACGFGFAGEALYCHIMDVHVLCFCLLYRSRIFASHRTSMRPGTSGSCALELIVRCKHWSHLRNYHTFRASENALAKSSRPDTVCNATILSGAARLAGDKHQIIERVRSFCWATRPRTTRIPTRSKLESARTRPVTVPMPVYGYSASHPTSSPPTWCIGYRPSM